MQFHRASGRDSAQVVTPFVQVGTYPTRNFATLGSVVTTLRCAPGVRPRRAARSSLSGSACRHAARTVSPRGDGSLGPRVQSLRIPTQPDHECDQELRVGFLLIVPTGRIVTAHLDLLHVEVDRATRV